MPVTGKIPEWLSGSYIRNGPGMFHLQNKRLNHWFDAMGALHKFTIANGKVSYQNAMIECESYKKVTETGDIQFSEFASDPCKSIFKKVQSYVFPSLPNMTDNPKVNVAKIAGKLMALGETPMQVEFDPHTLKTIGVSEPFFQPSPQSKNDEEGILISIVLDAAKQNSFLLLLDAVTIQEIARAVLPEPVVYGFHGAFFGMSKFNP